MKKTEKTVTYQRCKTSMRIKSLMTSFMLLCVTLTSLSPSQIYAMENAIYFGRLQMDIGYLIYPENRPDYCCQALEIDTYDLEQNVETTTTVADSVEQTTTTVAITTVMYETTTEETTTMPVETSTVLENDLTEEILEEENIEVIDEEVIEEVIQQVVVENEEVALQETAVAMDENVSVEPEQTCEYTWNGPVLTRRAGVVQGPSGKETFYNKNMNKVIEYMKSLGHDYTYWVRDDGVKMYGEYVMCAANLTIRPKGTLVPTSLGMGIVCDTGGFASSNKYQLDIAVNW